jgi:N-formylglutamate amidohydrolase
MFFEMHQWTCEEFTWVFEAAEGSPIIITVPHDRGFSSYDLYGLLESRENGIKGRDKYVWPIVKDILLGAKVNAVRGLLPRTFVDYNRPPDKTSGYSSEEEIQIAFDDPRLRGFYGHYHQTIAQLIRKAIEKFGLRKCLLMDLHGFSLQPPYGEYDLILGTGNRITVNSDVDQRLADFLATRGYRIFLPAEKPIGPSEDKYDAEFTTRHYAQEFGIDAIQIEIAQKFRVLEGIEVGQQLSADMTEFFTLYLAP